MKFCKGFGYGQEGIRDRYFVAIGNFSSILDSINESIKRPPR